MIMSTLVSHDGDPAPQTAVTPFRLHTPTADAWVEETLTQ